MDALRMIRIWACLALVAGVAPAAPQDAARDEARDNRSSRSDYVIEARLDGDTKHLSGRLKLTWHNRSADEVEDLWFHLYLNAFSNNRSRHLIEAEGRLRGHVVKEGWGWQQVTAVRTAAGENLMPTFRYEHPDEEEPSEDRTVFSVDLPRPVAPGESIEVEIEWQSQLPRVRRRTGFKEDFLYVAQWFPKLGVYEGGEGWNCHQFHMNTEFYAHYSTYDVTLDLPLEYDGKVGGSGVRVSSDKTDDGRVKVRFLAPSEADRETVDATGNKALVHDFAWTADPDYFVKTERFNFQDFAAEFPDEVARAQSALGADKNLRLRSVDVTAMIQPERAAQADRHIRATMYALFFYGLWFGEYPYEHVTVVDPAWGARAAGGMEYPTIFTAGTALFTTPDMYRPESVTVHEAGHQFWYGLVGNNEFEAAWMDEGFNSFSDSETLWRAYGPRRATTSYAGVFMDGSRVASLPSDSGLARWLTARRLRWRLGTRIANKFLPEHRDALEKWLDFEVEPLRPTPALDWWRDQPYLTLASQFDDPRWGDRRSYLRDPDTDPIHTRAWEYLDRNSYRTNSYPRPAVALRTLIGVVGWDAFLKGMRHYSEQWRYRHPYPQDFYESFIEGSGVDVQWFFDELFHTTHTVDWSVSVSQTREDERRGAFQGGVGEPFVLLEHDHDHDHGEPPAEPPAEEAEEQGADEDASATDGEGDGEARPPWIVEVVVRRKGELRLPLPLRLTWNDGSTEELSWSREDQDGTTWLRIRRRSDQKLKSVVLDPERLYYIDLDMSNNQWFTENDDVTPLRWTERVLTQYSHLLHWYSRIGG